MRHRARAPLLQRQAGLRAVDRLDLTLFIDGQHDGVRGRIGLQADDVAQLGNERARNPEKDSNVRFHPQEPFLV